MRDEDYAKLLEDTERELLAGRGPAGVLGLTPVTLRLLASLADCGPARAVEAVYTPTANDSRPPTRDDISIGARAAAAEAGDRVVAGHCQVRREPWRKGKMVRRWWSTP